MSDIKLLLTSEFMSDPRLGKNKYRVTWSGETPWGPLDLCAWGEDVPMAVRGVMARVERIANRRGPGRHPKNYQACCYVYDVFINPPRISSLNPTTRKEAVQPQVQLGGGKTAEQLLSELIGTGQITVAPPAAPTVQATLPGDSKEAKPQPTGRVIVSAVSTLLH